MNVKFYKTINYLHGNFLSKQISMMIDGHCRNSFLFIFASSLKLHLWEGLQELNKLRDGET